MGGKRIFARTHPHARTRAHSRLLQMRGESVAFMSTKRRRQDATKDSGAPPATPSVVKAATTASVPDAGASIASQFHEDPADLRPTNLRNMVNPFISARPGRLTEADGDAPDDGGSGHPVDTTGGLVRQMVEGEAVSVSQAATAAAATKPPAPESS